MGARALRGATNFCSGDDLRLTIVTVYSFDLFDVLIEGDAHVLRQPSQRAPSIRKDDPFCYETHATDTTLILDSF